MTSRVRRGHTLPAEMTGTGKIVDGNVHVHAAISVEGTT